jgi:hypothetical protein
MEKKSKNQRKKSSMGERTRLYQAKYLMREIKKNFGSDKPIIFCADMNAAPTPLRMEANSDTMIQQETKGETKEEPKKSKTLLVKHYNPETYNYLTQELKFGNSQMELLIEAGLAKDEFDMYTTAKIREKASAIVEDYILYNNDNDSAIKLVPTGHLSIPDLEKMKPILLPAPYYPSDHIAILTGFNLQEKTNELPGIESEPRIESTVAQRNQRNAMIFSIIIVMLLSVLPPVIFANLE